MKQLIETIWAQNMYCVYSLGFPLNELRNQIGLSNYTIGNMAEHETCSGDSISKTLPLIIEMHKCCHYYKSFENQGRNNLIFV